MDPVRPMSASSSALPGPSATSLPQRTRKRGCSEQDRVDLAFFLMSSTESLVQPKIPGLAGEPAKFGSFANVGKGTNYTKLSTGASAHCTRFSPSPRQTRKGMGCGSLLFSSSKPLAPALSPLGRGEGVGAVSSCHFQFLLPSEPLIPLWSGIFVPGQNGGFIRHRIF